MKTNIKSEIKKVITEYTKYDAKKVWDIKIVEDTDGVVQMNFEVTVSKKKINKK